jgi:hypothetical protein
MSPCLLRGATGRRRVADRFPPRRRSSHCTRRVLCFMVRQGHTTSTARPRAMQAGFRPQTSLQGLCRMRGTVTASTGGSAAAVTMAGPGEIRFQCIARIPAGAGVDLDGQRFYQGASGRPRATHLVLPGALAVHPERPADGPVALRCPRTRQIKEELVRDLPRAVRQACRAQTEACRSR